MTCTAVRRGVTEHGRPDFLSLSILFFMEREAFQSFSSCNRSHSVLILRLPIAGLGRGQKLGLVLAAVHRHNIYMDCNISSVNLKKKVVQTAFSDYSGAELRLF